MRAASLLLVAIWIAPATTVAQESTILLDPREEHFRITVPLGWRAVPSTGEAEYSQLALHSTGELDISIVVACRPLSATERDRSAVALLDDLIASTVRWTEITGNSIVEVGRTEPLTQDAPAFAAVAVNADRTQLVTVLRSVESDRTCVVTTLTDNPQGSPELMAEVTRVVGSLELL